MSEEVTAVDGAQAATPAPTEQATTQEPAPAQETQEPASSDKPRDDKGRFVPQERVNEITRARREAERRAEALERELSDLRQRATQPQPQAADVPTPEAFNYDPVAYGNAMAEYARRQAAAEFDRRFAQREQEQSRRTLAESFEERSRAYEVVNPGYGERLESLGRTVRFAPELQEAVMASEYGPQVVDHLAQHLDVADRIARLPVHLAVAELVRLEARVSAPKPAATTRAPAPVPTLGGSSTPAKDPAKMSYEEYKRHRMGG
jgi:hypothetical protein